MYHQKDNKNSISKRGRKRGKYNMKSSMSERMRGVSKTMSLEGCIRKWVALEARKKGGSENAR